MLFSSKLCFSKSLLKFVNGTRLVRYQPITIQSQCRNFKTLTQLHRVSACQFSSHIPRQSKHVKRSSKWLRYGSISCGSIILGATSINLYAHADGTTIDDEKLSVEYDADLIESFWFQHKAIALCRLFTICGEVLPLLLRLLWNVMVKHQTQKMSSLESTANIQIEGTVSSSVEDQRLAARDLRTILTRLGPMFIKFGQAMSIRPDILPASFLEELQKLCDSVPAYDTKEALKLIEDELGASVERIFLDLDEDVLPIAAASLGQVYRCRLRSTGETVALKVQRPDMLRAVTLDLFLLRRYFRFVEYLKEFIMTHFSTWMAPRRQFDLELFDTFAKATLHELDYILEAQSQEYFAREMETRMQGQVYIPRVHWDATSKKVLCSEWIEGKPLAQASPQEIQRLVPVGVECFLVQLLELGRFHSDPHPGNLIVESEASLKSKSDKPRLVLIDFGLVATLERPSMLRMAVALVHLIEGDIQALLKDGVALGFLDEDTDLNALGPELQEVLKQGRALAEEEMRQLPYHSKQKSVNDSRKNQSNSSGNISHGFDSRTKYEAVARRRKKFGSISNELNDLFFRYPFCVPEYFALVTRALIVLEGIALTGDPSFDIFEAAYPYAKNRALRLVKTLNIGDAIKLAKTAGSIKVDLRRL